MVPQSTTKILLANNLAFLAAFLLLQLPVTTALVAVYSMDNLQEEDDPTCDWLDGVDVTEQDLGFALLLVSSIRRMNDTTTKWVVPLYTLGVFGYLITIYVQRFQRKRALKRKQKQERKPVITITPTTRPAPQSAAVAAGEQPIDLSGAYKLVKIENLDAFLAAQGVPWPLRKAASKVMPIHHITHVNNNLTIRIDAGPIQTQTSYTINSGKVETNVRGRIFEDSVRYLQDEATGAVKGILTEKTAVTEGYRVTVSRQLSDDQQRIYMESIASWPNDPEKETIVSTQHFERIAASAN